MPQEITLKGLASQAKIQIRVSEEDLGQNLLHFLAQRSFPVASSCGGAGQCKKCVFNSNYLACEKMVKDFLGKEIRFDYL